jgi:hypothetical protein
MATSYVYRFFRFMRSICVPMTAIICFSCLLTFVFVLYQPIPAPPNRMGWQAYDTINNAAGQDTLSSGSSSGQSSSDGTTYTGVEGTDWWNVSTPGAETTDSASLPLDVWAPLLPHDTGCASFPHSLYSYKTKVLFQCQKSQLHVAWLTLAGASWTCVCRSLRHKRTQRRGNGAYIRTYNRTWYLKTVLGSVSTTTSIVRLECGIW